ncbi:MAG: DUF3267 domain-containing protein [Clostridia bacterium]|nr:DUF3267 domain-containing protein [Clostridia bacterium]
MFYWMKPLPDADIDYEKYKPFIKNDWFRRNFMYFVYVLQATLVILSIVLGVWNFSNFFIRLILFLLVYVVHELLHISVVWRIGDISLTHSGIFFWLNSSAKMSKLRFLLFMSMPLIILSIAPMIVALFSNGSVYQYMRYVAWINAIIAGADIINTFLIIIKPRNSVFYRGFYKVVNCEGTK